MSDVLATITVVAGLIQQGGRLLVCQRRRDGAFALKWEFPGGKVEPGETYEKGLRRELHEELGIDATLAQKPTVRATTIRENTRWSFCSITSLTSAVPCTTSPSRRSAGPTQQISPLWIFSKGMPSSLPS